MNDETPKRQVRIFDKKTGKYRSSEPETVGTTGVHVAYNEVSGEKPKEGISLYGTLASQIPGSEPGLASQLEKSKTALDSQGIAAMTGQDFTTGGNGFSKGEDGKAANKQVGGHALVGKPKGEIRTLEQFIAFAYSRKGQRVLLKPKVEQLIAQNPRLDESAQSRLLDLAAADTALSVPRQLLLIAKEIVGRPQLRSAILSFLQNVMLSHKAFGAPGVQAALRHHPDAPPPEDVLASIARYLPKATEIEQKSKPAELQELRVNATNLLAAWMAENRGLTLDEIAHLLFQVLWWPAARSLTDDAARLRALTEVTQAGGVGLACEKFRQGISEARSGLNRARCESTQLKIRVDELEQSAKEQNRNVVMAEEELASLRIASANELEEMRKRHEQECTHLMHELEQLRGRLLRLLGESADKLDVGLSALRKAPPRVEVMTERAEHVVDSLRKEQEQLREG